MAHTKTKCSLSFYPGASAKSGVTLFRQIVTLRGIYLANIECSRQWRTEGGGQGGHGPRAQALKGVPGQRVGASFKKKTRHRRCPSPQVSR